MPEWYDNDVDLDAALEALGAPPAAKPLVDAEAILAKAAALTPAATVATGLSGWKLYTALSFAVLFGFVGGLVAVGPSGDLSRDDSEGATEDQLRPEESVAPSEPKPIPPSDAVQESPPSPQTDVPITTPSQGIQTDGSPNKADKRSKRKRAKPKYRKKGLQRPIAAKPQEKPSPTSIAAEKKIEQSAPNIAGIAISGLAKQSLAKSFELQESAGAMRLNAATSSSALAASSALQAEEAQAKSLKPVERGVLEQKKQASDSLHVNLSAGIEEPHFKHLSPAPTLAVGTRYVNGEKWLGIAELRLNVAVQSHKDDKIALLPNLEVGIGTGRSIGPVDVSLSATTGARSVMVKKEGNGEFQPKLSPTWTLGGRLQADVSKKWFAATHVQVAPLGQGERLNWFGAEVGMRFNFGS